MKSNPPVTVLFCLALSLLACAGYGRIPEGRPAEAYPMEKLRIVPDRFLYLEGDTICIHLISTDRDTGRPYSLSGIAYVELLDRNERPVSVSAISLSGAAGSGWLKIPEDAVSDYYCIRAYTSWMRNAGPAFFAYAPVCIINPGRPLCSTSPAGLEIRTDTAGHGMVPLQEPESHTLLITAGLEHDVFGCREEVRLTIGTFLSDHKPVQAHLCVSVNPAMEPDPCLAGFASVTGKLKTEFTVHPGTILYLPEPEGPLVSGTLRKQESGTAMDHGLVTCSLVGSCSRFTVYTTGSDGKFRFVYPEEARDREVVIGVAGQIEPLLVEIDGPYENNFLDLILPPLQLDQSQVPHIGRRYVNKQVRAAYGTPQVIHQPAPVPEEVPFYGEASEIVELDDFIRLPVMEEIIREIVKRAVVYRNSGRLLIGVLDPNTKNIIGADPLFLLDGVPLFDHQVILGTDPRAIHSIRVVDSKYIIGDYQADGIIDIRSRNGFFEGFSRPPSTSFCVVPSPGFPVDPVSPERDAGAASADGHLPDFRDRLYWNPNLQVCQGIPSTVQFQTSDVPGRYRIVIQGLDQEGHFGRIVKEFGVVPDWQFH
ncbi:MAG: hypothetical protein V2B15_18145 [Bacteroidota bacterium]